MCEFRDSELTDYAASHMGVSFGPILGSTYLCVLRDLEVEKE